MADGCLCGHLEAAHGAALVCWCGHLDGEHRRTGAASWECAAAGCHCVEFVGQATVRGGCEGAGCCCGGYNALALAVGGPGG